MDPWLEHRNHLRQKMNMSGAPIYPQAGPCAGSLLRKVMLLFKQERYPLPISSHILIALSGGCDSIALADMLLRYGRRIIDKEKITLIHVNHGWRGIASEEDESFVRSFALRWGVPLNVQSFHPISYPKGVSWEAQARFLRQEWFETLASEKKALVLTAHHADDLAETVLWRLLTGGAKTHAGGIAFQCGSLVRPFLTLRKKEIKQYLNEVNQSYREDLSNHSDRFLRAKMRSQLMGTIEKLFPRSIEHLCALAFEAQNRQKTQGVTQEEPQQVLEALVQASGLRLKRSHWLSFLREEMRKKPDFQKIHLPEGWSLTHLQESLGDNQEEKRSEKWILERFTKK